MTAGTSIPDVLIVAVPLGIPVVFGVKVTATLHCLLTNSRPQSEFTAKQMVRDEISREISRQKVENGIKAVTGSVHVDLNEEYFGTSAQQPQSPEPAPSAPR